MEETRRRWPDPEAGPYQLTLRWEREDGRPQVAGFSLDRLDSSAPPVNTSLIRELKFAEIMIEDREQLPHLPQVKPAPELAIEGMCPSTVARLRRGAEIYMAAYRAGERPTKEVGRRMNLSPAAAANVVRRAREVGLLPPATPGSAQG